jgi:integrase
MRDGVEEPLPRPEAQQGDSAQPAAETREVNALTQVAKAKGESAYMIILIGLMVAITGRRRAEIMRLTTFELRDDGIHVVDCKTKAGDPERS